MCNLCLKAGMSRRLLMGAGLATAATLSFANKSAQAQPARLAETPDAALKLLVDGNARYVSGQMNERDFSAGRAARAQGQAPIASILGCADSRVSPELAFDQIPGDLFVVRVAGNFMTPDGLGSYAGAVVQVREDGAVLFDFNHPLAGQPVTFEVQIIGVL